MNRLSLVAVCLSGALAFGCGPKEFGSVCNEVPAPAECMTACDPLPGAPSSCPAGFHCSPGGLCNAQCTVGGGQCGDGYACTADGYCIADDGEPMNGPDASCPSVTFTPMPTTPSIGLVLDQSGSMYTQRVNGQNTSGGNCGDPQCRFLVMRNALVGPTGVVTQLESKAYFGSNLYTCDGNNNNQTTNTPRALNNAAAIRAAIDAKVTTVGTFTPTHAGINDMVATFGANPPPAGSPPVIVLATDGLPNSCSNSGGGGEGPTVTAARNAYLAGIPVYVLAIGTNSGHFQDVANAGQGHMAGQPNVTYYPVNNAGDLAAAFQTIINGVISCDLSLTSSIDATQAMNGTLTVNGAPQAYGTDWILVNGNIIRLQGAACDGLKNATNPAVSATFPCGSIIF